MLLNRSHIPWALLVTGLSAAAGVLYLANFHPAILPFNVHLPPQLGPVPPTRNTVGGTPLGLIFGSISLLIFLFASALGIRKKRRTWPIGNVKFWLKAHIWLTILTIPLVCFHSGFRMGGTMTSWLVILYGIVMASGFFGLALQQVLPSIMMRRLPREVIYEEIPYIRETLIESAERLWEELSPVKKKLAAMASAAHGGLAPTAGGTAVAVQGAAVATMEPYDPSPQIMSEFLHDECLPYLRAKNGEKFRLADPKQAEDVFRLLRLNVTEDWRDKVDCMNQWCEDRRLLDIQTRLHHWLHTWLLVHVPFSFALLVLTIWHAYVTLLYL